jgi:hypothetical protein
MANVHPGYRGFADIGGVGQVRFSDAGINARQSVDAPDLVMGDWDHDAYNYGKIEVGGSVSGPISETFISGAGGGVGLWNYAVKRYGECGDLLSADTTLYYYCGTDGNNSRVFRNMFANSIEVSCSAGDVGTFSLDLAGDYAEPWTSVTPPHYTTAEKLVTWDKINVRLLYGGDNEFTVPTNIAYSNFSFTIGNNLTPVYSLGQTNLFPYEVVPGLRTISGSLSVYNIPQSDGALTWDSYNGGGEGQIQFDIAGLEITMRVRFFRVEAASSATPIISTLGFVGVSHQTGSEWEG